MTLFFPEPLFQAISGQPFFPSIRKYGEADAAAEIITEIRGHPRPFARAIISADISSGK